MAKKKSKTSLTIDDSFRQDIIEHPYDDAPRLIYADWLEENGQPERAELIRIQIELARWNLSNTRRAELKEIESSLLRLHWNRWTEDIYPDITEACFHRGFIERANFSIDWFLKNAELLFRREPLRYLALREEYEVPNVEQLASCAHLARISTLDLINLDLLETEQVLTLLRSPHLGGIERLGLEVDDLEEGVQALAESECLTSLTELFLHGGNNCPAGAVLLAGSELLKRLSGLSIYDNGLGMEFVEALAASPYVSGLLDLDLTGNSLGDSGAKALVRAGRLRNLCTVMLPFNSIRDDGARAFLNCQLPDLEELDLDGNPISREVANELLHCPRLAGRVVVPTRRQRSKRRSLS
jgi:uncharacterized protein (TIGR02996 family)